MPARIRVPHKPRKVRGGRRPAVRRTKLGGQKMKRPSGGRRPSVRRKRR